MRIGICNIGFKRYGGIEHLVSNIGNSINDNGHDLIVMHDGLGYEGPPNKACYNYLPSNYFLNRLCNRSRNFFVKRSMKKHGAEADHWLVGHFYLLHAVLAARNEADTDFTVSMLAHRNLCNTGVHA